MEPAIRFPLAERYIHGIQPPSLKALNCVRDEYKNDGSVINFLTVLGKGRWAPITTPSIRSCCYKKAGQPKDPWDHKIKEAVADFYVSDSKRSPCDCEVREEPIVVESWQNHVREFMDAHPEYFTKTFTELDSEIREICRQKREFRELKPQLREELMEITRQLNVSLESRTYKLSELRNHIITTLFTRAFSYMIIRSKGSEREGASSSSSNPPISAIMDTQDDLAKRVVEAAKTELPKIALVLTSYRQTRRDITELSLGLRACLLVASVALMIFIVFFRKE